MGTSFNQFTSHIWGPFLRDMVNISLREQFIHKLLQYSTTKLESRAPIKICELKVYGLIKV
jgi:hypothetical protein